MNAPTRAEIAAREIPVTESHEKYDSKNPIARRLLDGFLGSFDALVAASGARQAHEVGCGWGHLSIRMALRGLQVRGCDAFPATVERARARGAEAGLPVRFEVASIYDLVPERDAAELVVCCEVLEHLEHPDRALEVLAKLARPHLLVSVPREPIWRTLNLARGKYVRELGNTPGHINHWSRAGFVRFLSRRLEVLESRSPLPWTMVLCRSRSR